MSSAASEPTRPWNHSNTPPPFPPSVLCPAAITDSGGWMDGWISTLSAVLTGKDKSLRYQVFEDSFINTEVGENTKIRALAFTFAFACP